MNQFYDDHAVTEFILGSVSDAVPFLRGRYQRFPMEPAPPSAGVTPIQS